MGFFAPATGSSLDTEVEIVGAEKAAVWLQIVAADNSSASAAIYDDTTCTAGRQIGRLAASASRMGPVVGPFISTCSIYLGNLEGGSVNAWVRPTSR